jgi:(1->4)-alpha-D-glucan 1-alpha-D-glucosylmutase
MAVVPTATYRIQFDPAHLDFDAAIDLVPQLARLGVSHVYASPVLRSRPASSHGYDMIDPTTTDPELGGDDGFEAFAGALHRHSMGLILDIVPNHMAVGRHNPWWMEVLAKGRRAQHARHFDLFWDDQELPLPFLGRPYAEALEAGEIRLVQEDDTVMVAYWDDRFPLSPMSIEAAGISGTEPAADTIAEINEDPGMLHRLLDAQHYRLVWWQLSRERLSHRRFFTITDLVGVRQEDPVVFEDTHRLVLNLVGRGLVDGLRIDHVDGLRDPTEYLDRLRERAGDRLYLVVEKILAPHETLPKDWRIEGTTGYDYLGIASKLFVDPDGYETLSGHYRSFTGGSLDFDAIVGDQQRFIMHERLGPETARFAATLERLARRDRRARDVLPSELIDTAVDVLAALPVYRTYVRDGNISLEDRAAVEAAIGVARDVAPQRDPRIFDFLEEVLCLAHGPEIDVDERRRRERFVADVQQFTGAVMAKGVEDTAYYQYNLLVSLNEVGAHPGPPGDDPVADYHAHNLRVAAEHPHTMTAADTHDTKRSEDVRTRISAISQMADRWSAKVELWHARNRHHRTGPDAPTRNEELLIYQTLVGSWPLEPSDDFGERLCSYLVKAAREAKVHTAWLKPVIEHETDLISFASNLIADEEFTADLEHFSAPLWNAGALDSLAQVALRLFAPGVPDIYQGHEVWDLSLTDPDNRRPVDWAARRHMLDDLEARRPGPGLIDELAGTWRDGRIKLLYTRTGLAARRDRPELFADGSYVPLDVDGDRADHVIAFARRHGDDWAIAVAPRLTMALGSSQELWARDGWDDTRLVMPDDAPRMWSDLATDIELAAEPGIRLAELFARVPVGMLTNRGGGSL